MSMFGDGDWNKNELYDNINMFFKQGGTTKDLFDVVHAVFEYGWTPDDILTDRIDKAVNELSEGVKFCENDSQGAYDICNMAINREKRVIAILKGE